MLEAFQPFLPLVISASIAALLSVVGLVASRRLGLTPAQTKYVDTLEGLNSAMEKKIDYLESELASLRLRFTELEKEFVELRKLNDELKQENFELRSQIAVGRRRGTRTTPNANGAI